MGKGLNGLASSRLQKEQEGNKKRMICSPKQKKEEVQAVWKGSMTVETALVLPLFLFIFLSLSFFVEAVRLQIHIGCAAGQVSKELASYGYTYRAIKNNVLPEQQDREAEEGSSDAWITTVPGMWWAESRIVDLVGKEYLDSSMIVNGSRGLSLIGSEVFEDGKWMTLVVSYKIKLPFGIVPTSEIKLVQHAKSHAWVGYERGASSKKESPVVYMTEFGRKYHLRRSCKHLNRSVRCVSKEALLNCRNKSGSKYYPCHLCMTSANGYYITDYGTSYHARADCSAISRNIIEKRLDSLNPGIECCKECGKGK